MGGVIVCKEYAIIVSWIDCNTQQLMEDLALEAQRERIKGCRPTSSDLSHPPGPGCMLDVSTQHYAALNTVPIKRFREQGHMYHFIDDLVASNEKPNNLQLYFSDHENELASRMAKKPQTIRGKANDKKGLRSHGDGRKIALGRHGTTTEEVTYFCFVAP
ncbi:hypothetical protein H5410_005241 [Solanum commersonii]|uniref:Uncharacterized protein n=1 Tax=Solanum commersonii TaxID=4109 RepID=A0A9J6A7L4_SOLCO|nr:hypothetical protein H5410_005241 [Solanum commersonii]